MNYLKEIIIMNEDGELSHEHAKDIAKKILFNNTTPIKFIQNIGPSAGLHYIFKTTNHPFSLVFNKLFHQIVLIDGYDDDGFPIIAHRFSNQFFKKIFTPKKVDKDLVSLIKEIKNRCKNI